MHQTKSTKNRKKKRGKKKLCFHTKEHWENVIVNYLIVIRGTELTEGNESYQEQKSQSQRDAFRFSHLSLARKLTQNPKFDEGMIDLKIWIWSNTRTKLLDFDFATHWDVCIHVVIWRSWARRENAILLSPPIKILATWNRSIIISHVRTPALLRCTLLKLPTFLQLRAWPGLTTESLSGYGQGPPVRPML